MALGNPTQVANAGETTADNQTVITTTADIPNGQYILATAISNSTDTTDGETTHHTALTVGSVSLTKRKEFAEGGASATAAIVTSQWYGTNNSGSTIASGSNVTLDLDASIGDKRISVLTGTRDTAKTFEPADGTSLVFENYVSAGGNDMKSHATSGMTSEEHIHLASWGCDATATGFTASTNFTRVTTTGQVTGTNGMREEWRINTSTGETEDPASNCGNATEWAMILGAYREVAAAGVTVKQLAALGAG